MPFYVSFDIRGPAEYYLATNNIYTRINIVLCYVECIQKFVDHTVRRMKLSNASYDQRLEEKANGEQRKEN